MQLKLVKSINLAGNKYWNIGFKFSTIWIWISKLYWFQWMNQQKFQSNESDILLEVVYFNFQVFISIVFKELPCVAIREQWNRDVGRLVESSKINKYCKCSKIFSFLSIQYLVFGKEKFGRIKFNLLCWSGWSGILSKICVWCCFCV